MGFFSRMSVNTKYNLISSTLLIALFVALAYSNYRREQSLVVKGAVDKARTISRQIVEMRDYLSKSVSSEPEHNENLIPQVAASRVARQLDPRFQLLCAAGLPALPQPRQPAGQLRAGTAGNLP